MFIAANIVDEELIRGPWGSRVVELVELLGRENVFLSIYENDSGEGTRAALRELGEKVQCELFPASSASSPHETFARRKWRRRQLVGAAHVDPGTARCMQGPIVSTLTCNSPLFYDSTLEYGWKQKLTRDHQQAKQQSSPTTSTSPPSPPSKSSPTRNV